MHYIPPFIRCFLFLIILSGGLTGQMTMTRAGKLDTTFGTGGFAVPQAGMAISQSIDATLSPNGSVFLVHNVFSQGHPAVLVTKQLANGSMDTTFGQNGTRVVAPVPNCYATALTTQPDGKVLVGGYVDNAGNGLSTGYDLFVLRLTTAGDLDTSFAAGGIFIKDYTPTSEAYVSYERVGSVSVQPDGKIVVAGMVEHFSPVSERSDDLSVIARLDTGGTLDPSFGTAGSVMVPIGRNRTNFIDGTVIARPIADGTYLAGASVDVESQTAPGNYAPHAILLKFLSDGSLDTSFSGDGLIDISLAYSPGYPTYFYDLRVLPGGGFLALTSDGLVTLTASGTFDPAFGTGGRVLMATDWFPKGLEVMPDGKIVASGLFGRPLQPTGVRFIGRLRRFWPNGSTDLRFGQGGISNVEITGQNITLGRIAVIDNKSFMVFGLRNIPSGAAPFVARFYATR